MTATYEYSLLIENIFVSGGFQLFRDSGENKHRVLFTAFGRVIFARVYRARFGEAVSMDYLSFGGFLIVTGSKMMLRERGNRPERIC